MNAKLLPIALLLALGTAAGAQTPAPTAVPLFPFAVPWSDSTPGTLTDVSWLNAKPAGVNGFIRAQNGHFIESNTHHRVRFLGVNFAAAQAFPAHADAEKEAAHLAKEGFNLVRLHHMDNNWAGPTGSLWDFSRADRQHINPAQLERLDYLLAQFKKHGIYANINLHVSRQFSAADGFPASVGTLPFGSDKRVDEFDRRMILLQKNYARDLLTHVNPYTKLSYANDPAVAVVELNNENSLTGYWGPLGIGLDTLPEPFRGELVGFWNQWLHRKYATDTKMLAAWNAGLTPLGPGLLSQSSVWSTEHQGTAQADFVPAPAPQDTNAPAIHVHIAQTDGTGWHVQAYQTGLALREGATYTVSFRAKASVPRTIGVGFQLDQPDWHGLGLDRTPALSTDWQTFHYVCSVQNTVPRHGRLSFTFGDGPPGDVFIDSVQVRPGVQSIGLPSGQSLSTKTIGIPGGDALKAQHSDWIAFLADTERAYAEEMRAYLKNTLHVHANVICSQMGYGGLTSLGRNQTMDFADNHSYWQHPSFPHAAWDPKDWTIGNTPMVTDLANGGGGTLRGLAQYRVAGKPYSISEYDHPSPSEYRAEMLPEYATFAAAQDWDMIYLFAQGEYGAGASTDKVGGFFDTSNDPADAVFLPAAALIFRAAAIPAVSGDATVVVPKNQTVALETAGDAWYSATHQGKVSVDTFTQKLSLRLTNTNAPAVLLTQTRPGLSAAAAALRLAKTAAGPLYTAASPTAQALAGYVGGQTVKLGGSAVAFPAFGSNFAAITLVAMDQKPLSQSRRLLLTLAGHVENQDMGWNPTRTSVGDQWGHGPVTAEGIPATVSLKTNTPRHVFALDPTGKQTQPVPATFAHGTLQFSVGPQYHTLWYAIVP